MIKTAFLSSLFAFAVANAATLAIMATNATLSFPSHTTAIIRATDGTPYRLAITVDPTVDGLPTNLSLVLQRVGAKLDADNLLDPPGNWHGYQPYFFAAEDFKDGPAKSLFGPARDVCRNRTGLETTIKVRNVAVAPSGGLSTLQFRSLVLDIELKSVPLVGGKRACKNVPGPSGAKRTADFHQYTSP